MQTHLNLSNTVNLGSFYTPDSIVQRAYEMLEKVADLRDFLIFDSSCGYGDFFVKNLNYLGADIDEIALQRASFRGRKIHANSLLNVSRAKFGIKENEKLIIIGNPPYNDRTSMVKGGMKRSLFEIDGGLNHRDLGISFLRSYDVLRPEFVCVLHPLSYLIKRANFAALQGFKEHYRLIDGLVISSQIFTPNSNTFFPILIALYGRGRMNFDFINNYQFKTLEGDKFRISEFDFIGNYITKYPNHADKRDAVAYFYTMRDINALKRSRTFLDGISPNAIKVFAENLRYYCYVFHFKQFLNQLPYWCGNLDVFINNREFLRLENEFLRLEPSPKIEQYFRALFKEKL